MVRETRKQAVERADRAEHQRDTLLRDYHQRGLELTRAKNEDWRHHDAKGRTETLSLHEEGSGAGKGRSEA